MKEKFSQFEKKEEHIYRGRDAEAYKKWLEQGGFNEQIGAFESAVNIAELIKKKGGRALLVGGGVRDEILGTPIKDFDLEVYNLQPEELKDAVSQLGKVNEVGVSFGVLKLRVGNTDIDLSLPRRESKIGKGHKGFAVDTDPKMTIKEAARRRDFTFNSLAKDILTGEIYDYFGGVEDLRNRILRVTDEERFKDDPLRVLRAVQFIGRFGLSVDDKSAEIIRSMRGELRDLPKERMREEWLKLFLRSDKPSLGLNAAMSFGIFHELHKNEIPPLASTPQEPEWHPEGDVWVHTLMATDEAAKIIRRENLSGKDAAVVILASFVHDFGKPITTKREKGRIRALGHEEAGISPAMKFLSDIGIEQSLRSPIAKLVADHLRPNEWYRKEVEKGERISDGAFIRLAKRISPATLTQLAFVAEADRKGRGKYVDAAEPENHLISEKSPVTEWFLKRAKELNIEREKPAPVLYGRDLIALGFKPGKIFGEIIRAAENLRESKNMSREQILGILYDKKESSPEEALKALQNV